ncbi:MAG: glycosyltransferase family 87 protein [Candidatus Dormibacteraceae bacterium]
MIAIAFWWLTLIDLRYSFGDFPKAPDPNDFSLYYDGARIGLVHGWSHIYDLAFQRVQFIATHAPGDEFSWKTLYVTPPPVAWLVAPLARLPLTVAYDIWVLLNAALYAVAGWLAIPGNRLRKLAILLVGATAYPVLYALKMGQIVPLAAGSVILAWSLLKRDRQVAAGLVLLAVLLKPQVAILCPLILIFTGHRRALVAWTLGALGLAVASALTLGSAGLAQYAAALGVESPHLGNQTYTLAALLGAGPLARTVELACGGVALVAAWRHRRSLELALVAGLLGSYLASPYHHDSDLFALVVAAWLYLGSEAPRWQWAGAAALLVTMIGLPHLGPAPVLLLATLWLLTILVRSRQPRVPDPPGRRVKGAGRLQRMIRTVRALARPETWGRRRVVPVLPGDHR